MSLPLIIHIDEIFSLVLEQIILIEKKNVINAPKNISDNDKPKLSSGIGFFWVMVGWKLGPELEML